MGSEAGDFGERKIKLRGHCGGREFALYIVGFSLDLSGLGEEGGLFDGLLEGGFALGLGFLEKPSFSHGGADAAFVEREQVHVLGVGGPGDGLREGGLCLGMLGGDFIGFGDGNGAGVDIE